MQNRLDETTVGKENDQVFVEGLDFYFEGGFMVLTSRYLQNRGYCCDNGCRHCPFESGPAGG